MKSPIVVDTSVFISALIGKQGPSREILRRCLLKQLNPIISNPLFQEYEDVSKRENIIEKCPLNQEEVRELLDAFYSVCSWIPIYYLWRPNLIDESDNFLIELAIAGNAELIITNNIRDLIAAELSFPELKIVTPEVFLKGK